MLINIAPYGIIFLVAGLLLVLRGQKRKDVESASVGGLLLGAGVMVLAVEFFYILQLEDEGGGYSGTPVSEALLVAFLAAGLALVIMSLLGWGMRRLFWQLLAKA